MLIHLHDDLCPSHNYSGVVFNVKKFLIKMSIRPNKTYLDERSGEVQAPDKNLTTQTNGISHSKEVEVEVRALLISLIDTTGKQDNIELEILFLG